jgi:hypothetical protein
MCICTLPRPPYGLPTNADGLRLTAAGTLSRALWPSTRTLIP